MYIRFILALIAFLPAAVEGLARQHGYGPDWASLDSRPMPEWFTDSKFGVAVHWGLYSVPAWAPPNQHAEWYWRRLEQGEQAYLEFHERAFGSEVGYADLAPRFRAELFDPQDWAELFVQSGARYVVLTAKHHDGYALWPSEQAWNWNSADVGPHQDLVQEVSWAVRARGLRMGLYFSLAEWYNPHYQVRFDRYAEQHVWPQLRDLVNRYQPDIVWADGEWDHPSRIWRSPEFLSWLFNEAPNREDVVVNDRWGEETRSRHGGFFTTEYGEVHWGKKPGPELETRVWEESRGIGSSFGFNRRERASDYASARELIHLLVDVVSRGGNLLLGVGPTADGRIPLIEQDRLLEIGRWLNVNGEAIYETRAWRQAGEHPGLRFTRKADALYVFALEWPGSELELSLPSNLDTGSAVYLLGYDDPLNWDREGDTMRVQLPSLPSHLLPSAHAFAFRLEGFLRD